MNWPDDIRLKMIEKSEFYSEPRIYQYGFHDGYQEASYLLEALEDCVKTMDMLEQSGHVGFTHSDVYKQAKSAINKAKGLPQQS